MRWYKEAVPNSPRSEAENTGIQSCDASAVKSLGTRNDDMLRQQAKGEVLLGQLIWPLPGNSCDVRNMEQQLVCLVTSDWSPVLGRS